MFFAGMMTSLLMFRSYRGAKLDLAAGFAVIGPL